jgi:hypothetical protein
MYSVTETWLMSLIFVIAVAGFGFYLAYKKK